MLLIDREYKVESPRDVGYITKLLKAVIIE
jgi:hypothetical protein